MAERCLRAEARQIQRAIENLGSRGKTTRLPETIRARVLEYVARGRAQGASWSTLGQAVGLSATTLQRWRANTPDLKPAGALVPVQVEGDGLAFSSTGSSIILYSPTGWRVEGLEVSDAIAVLRALA